MKKIIIAAILISASFTSFAQDHPKDGDDESTGGGLFKKENFFTGGGLDLSLSTYGTVLGLEPEFGYSLNNWVGVGVVLNFIYSSQRGYYPDGTLDGYKYRQTDIGPGAFARIYPVNFLFIQAQYENNFIKYKAIDPYDNSSTLNTSAPSLLLGAGYCSGREGAGGEPFFYLSVSADVLARYYSPYVAIDGGGNTIILPIIRGGIQVPLFQNSSSHSRRHHRSDY